MPTYKNDSVVSVSTSSNKPAVQGEGNDNEGVRGVSHNAHGGIVGINDAPSPGGNGGWFESAQGEGVRGVSKNQGHGGVVGVNTAGGPGVYGSSDKNSGVVGQSTNGIGVFGESKSNGGVRGVSHGPDGGVVGINDAPSPGGNGGWFESAQGEGVRGWSKNPDHGGVVGVNTGRGGTGVYGTSESGVGVWGTSVNFEGIHAETQSSSTSAMAAYQMNANSGTAAFFARHMGNRTAGHFVGDIEVTGDIRLLNADCAEDFTIGGSVKVEPGTVMVLGEEGELFPNQRAYDKRVAGVISGAGDYKPGIVLDKQQGESNRQPIALLGKVYCKVDAQYGFIGVGDLLTTSPTPGHAMKADDPIKALGAIIGKALRPLKEGQGLIPILIALQ